MAHARSGHEHDNYSKDFDKFSKYVNQEKLKEEIGVKGIATGLCSYINKSLGSWKKRQINIAVSGNGGAGKSSLINALRGLKADDIGAAKVGVTETTKTRKKYTYPENDHVAIWDLPGLDSTTFQQETYFKDQNFLDYDVVIVVIAARFVANNMWLATECIQRNMNVLIVRSRIDEDIRNEKEDKSNVFNEKQCLQNIKGEIKSKLHQGNISSTDCNVFLVSSKERTSYDLDSLKTKLKGILNNRGKAMHAILKKHITPTIEEKREFYKSEFLLFKGASVVTGFLPLPLLETVTGNKSIHHCFETCVKTFGLDESSLRKFGREVSTTTNEIKRQLWCFKSSEEENQTKYESTEDKKYSTFEKYSKYLLPGIGSILSAYKSFKITEECLAEICDMFAKDVLKLVEIRLEKLEEELRVL